MQKKPDGIGRARWEELKREIIQRSMSKRKTAMSIKAHNKEMNESMADDINRVRSIWDKISDVEVAGNGVVQSNYIVE